MTRRPDPLLPDVCDFIDRYVVLTDAQRLAVALWAIHTHAIDAAEQTPYILPTSAEPRSGKSRLLEALELLVARPWVAISPSEAVLYRQISADPPPTLLLDEADTIFSPSRNSDRYEGVRALLNAGHRRGATVPRCTGPTMQIVEFGVFGAKCIAGIGTLPATVADRGIPIRMERKRRDEQVERFIRRDVKPAADTLRERVAAWAEKHVSALTDARPDMPRALNDRMVEGCEPLVAIADRMGYGAEARAALVALCSGERLDDVESRRIRLLRDMRRVVRRHERRIGRRVKGMPTTALLSRLVRLEESGWDNYYGRQLTPKDLADLLRPYGLRSKPIRFGDKVVKGYRRADLTDAWGRYL